MGKVVSAENGNSKKRCHGNALNEKRKTGIKNALVRLKADSTNLNKENKGMKDLSVQNTQTKTYRGKNTKAEQSPRCVGNFQ